MCPESKIKRSQTRLAQAPYERLGVGKTISVVAHIKILKSCFSSFNVVFILSDHFFDFRPIFKCHTQRMKESIESSGADLYGKSFEKKWLILGEAISRNLISFSFCRFPDSGHFWITQKNQNQSIQSRKISCNWRFFFLFFRLSQKERILESNKKILTLLITGELVQVSPTISIALFWWFQRFMYFFLFMLLQFCYW